MTLAELVRRRKNKSENAPDRTFHPLAKTMWTLSNIFSSARNPLMHDDRSPSPPLIKIKTQDELVSNISCCELQIDPIAAL